MTDIETAFQTALDAEPGSAALRLKLAAHLEVEGDERAFGYKMLGLLDRAPADRAHGYRSADQTHWTWVIENNVWAREGAFGDHVLYAHALPTVWGLLVETDPRVGNVNVEAGWRSWKTRREADDAAAVAWAKLPEDVKVILIARTL